jgi:putative ABC transport system ATP-binding protein
VTVDLSTASTGIVADGDHVTLQLPSGDDHRHDQRCRPGGHDVADLDDRQLAGLRARRIGFALQAVLPCVGASALDHVADGLLYT